MTHSEPGETTVQRLLVGVWLALGVIPLLLPRDPALASASLAVVAAVLWLGGWWILRRGLVQDPTGQILGALVGGRAGPATLAFLLAGGLLLGASVSVGSAGVFELVGGLALLLAWSGSPNRTAFTGRLATGLLGTGAVLFCLAAAEAVFRLPPIVARTGGSKPGRIKWEKSGYDRLWERNSLRLRSLHMGPKREGVLRVVALGDSFTWGYFVPRTEDVWPYVLERRLSRREQPVEVVNLGRNGTSTKDQAALLDELGWLFEPDLLLVQYTLNDPITGPYRDHFTTYPLIPWFNGILDRRSYFFSFLHAQWVAVQMRIRYPAGESGLYQDEFPGWRESRTALQQIGEAARGRGVPVFLVLFPYFHPGRMDSAGYPFHLAHDSVRTVASEAGYQVLDLGPAFWRHGREGRSWWAVPSDPHPGVEAHRLAGEAVAGRLASWVSDRSENRVDERRQH